jgi:hypothetical protein
MKFLIVIQLKRRKIKTSKPISRNMDKANYIIFHPDHVRQKIKVSATVMVNNLIVSNWEGNIHVDKIGAGNEDPFVFNNPWLYSYCHASQLRRNIRNDSYLQVGSKLIFVSGQHADNKFLTVDTVFLIGEVVKWGKPLELPIKYKSHFHNNNSKLWLRHLRFPFHGHHKTVSHSYESELWNCNKTEFSFLPLDKVQNRISIPFNEFDIDLIKKIEGNVKGKYPVLLNDIEIKSIELLIDKYTATKVLKDITSQLSIISKKGKC